MLLLLRRRERLEYFICESLFEGRRLLLGSSVHASETASKINTVNKYSLCDMFHLGNILVIVHIVSHASTLLYQLIGTASHLTSNLLRIYFFYTFIWC